MALAPRDVLMIKMEGNDAGALTVGGYLQELLRVLWLQKEGFSGKRPFGNSGWHHELYTALIRAGASTGKLDDDGHYVEDEGNADEVIAQAIDALFVETWATEHAHAIAAAVLRREASRLDLSCDPNE